MTDLTTRPSSSATEAVRRRYDELAQLLDRWRRLPPRASNDRDLATATRFVVAEARLLDDGRLDDWLTLWAHDGVLWIPIDPERHPADDQAVLLDDVRRLGERIRWLRLPSAWSQHPAPQTVRAVGNVESIESPDGGLSIRAVVVIAQHGEPHQRVWATHQFFELTSPGETGIRRLRSKIICAPAVRHAVAHPAVLL